MQKQGRTLIFRIIHIDNLHVCLEQGGLWASAAAPAGGPSYRPILDPAIHARRCSRSVPCGPGGTLVDYVPFYFGTRSPMLYRIHTRYNIDYDGGQEPIIYLVSSCETVRDAGTPFVFTDGHAATTMPESRFFDDMSCLRHVDFEATDAEWWRNTLEDSDRERRKQAEFLVHHFCNWSLVLGIGVIDGAVKARVENILGTHPQSRRVPVRIRRNWYY